MSQPSIIVYTRSQLLSWKNEPSSLLWPADLTNLACCLGGGIPLHSAGNAWKQVKDKEDLPKNFRAILNKITPTNSNNIFDQIDALPIKTGYHFQIVLGLVFDKAVDEPIFCSQYANLCKHLCQLSLQKGSREGTNFLLTRCQKEFETDMYAGIGLEAKQHIIDDCMDKVSKRALEEQLFEEKRVTRQKSLGISRLIGELYRLGMLQALVMVKCMKKLVRGREDESLECLCILLRTIGKQLEDECTTLGRVGSHFEPCFSCLKDIVGKKLAGVRVRFLIQDVLDMRSNGWRVREVQDVKPLMIAQNHASEPEELPRKAAPISRPNAWGL